MRLSTKGRYAVMAMVDLAKHGTRRRRSRWPRSPSARRSRCPIWSSFSPSCARAAWCKSVRGPGGGYLLAHGADETRISDIILAVDEPIRATRCTPGAPTGCRGNKSRCLTHDLWEELGNQIHLYLSSVTLADVCERRVLGRSGVLPSRAPHAQNRTPPSRRSSRFRRRDA